MPGEDYANITNRVINKNNWDPNKTIPPTKIAYRPSDTNLNSGQSNGFLDCLKSLTTIKCLWLEGVNLLSKRIPNFTRVGDKVEALELVDCRIADAETFVNYLKHFTGLKRLLITLPIIGRGAPPNEPMLPTLKGSLQLDFESEKGEVDSILGGLFCFPLRFSRVCLIRGSPDTLLQTFLNSLGPTLVELELDGEASTCRICRMACLTATLFPVSWGSVDLRALNNLQRLELMRYTIKSDLILGTIKSINSTQLGALLLSFDADHLRRSCIAGRWKGGFDNLDRELLALHNRIGIGHTLYFCMVPTTQGDLMPTENMSRTLLRDFTGNERVVIDEMPRIAER